jgi:undecaprenyl diphosphate synthase
MENWGRRADEVTFLMGLVARVLRDNTAELASQGVRLHFIGDIRGLSPDMQREISR